jgi:hypothetical protein
MIFLGWLGMTVKNMKNCEKCARNVREMCESFLKVDYESFTLIFLPRIIYTCYNREEE